MEIAAEIKTKGNSPRLRWTHPDFLIISLDESGRRPQPLRHMVAPLSEDEDSGAGSREEVSVFF